MRIAHVANFYGPTSGGVRTAMHALGSGYRDRGHDVLLIVPGESTTAEETPFGTRIQVKAPVLPFSGGYRVITNTKAVRRAIESFSPDVLEVSDRTTLRSLGSWAKRKGIPSVFFAHERADGVARANLPGWLARALPVESIADAHNRSTSRMFSSVVCTTDFALAEFERAGLGAHKIALGVDLDRFNPVNASRGIRGEFADAEEALLVMAARLSREKRPEIAIDAVRELTQRGVKVRLVCAGSGNAAAAMRESAQGLPVTFLGFVTDRSLFASLLASADVVLAPGPIETFGLAALEALASGTPVVVNEASALPEVIGSAGLAAQGTGTAFADAISTLLDQPEHERRSTARARALTMPWSRTVDSMLALHGSNIDSRLSPSRR